MIDVIAVALVSISALLATEWVVAYHRQTRGRWRTTEMGRHAMAAMTVIAVVFGLYAVHLIIGDDAVWFRWIRLAALAGVPVVIVWRRILLHRAQHDRLGRSR